MKFDFGDYIYFYNGNTAATTQRAAQFDKKVFQDFIDKRQYLEAADYAAKYHYKDPTINAEHLNDIETLRREGRKLNAIYRTVEEGSREYQALDFNSYVFSNKGFIGLDGNEFVDKFNDLKRSIGSTDKDEATKLRFTFKPEKQYGIFGWDWTARDNPYTLQEFMKMNDYSIDGLQSAGIIVDEKNNSITFEKNNPEANRLIYNVINSKVGTYEPIISGLNDNGDIIDTWDNDEDFRFRIADTSTQTGNNSYGRLRRMKELIDDAKSISDDIVKNNKLDRQSMSLMNYGFPSSLMKQRTEENSEDKAFTAVNNILDDVYKNQLMSYSAGATFYSNFANDDKKDFTLNEVPIDERQNLVSDLAYAINNDLADYSFATMGDTIGTLVTWTRPTSKLDELLHNDADRIQVFIPGALEKQAQQYINDDTTGRAVRELSDMKAYNYSYTTADGGVIKYMGGDMFSYEDKAHRVWSNLTNEAALHYMNKSKIMEVGARAIVDTFLSQAGNITDEAAFDKAAKDNATIAVNELYPELEQETPEQIFNQDPHLDENGVIQVDQNMQHSRYKKVQDAYELYFYFLNAANYLRQ